ncbi:NADP-dependent oxidoreductase domain-containing protein [Dichotomocladium elegans]|nr:NADP-dependent oxidoreductase domain-containing protein [Dichotomocladium elegans]
MSIKLNNGHEMPYIGFGTYGGPSAPKEVYEGAKEALKVGYKHFDTAYVYGTEKALADAIRDSGVPAEELFVTTKLWQVFHEPQHVRPACERSLKNLGLKTLNLYLIHWPLSWEFRGYEPTDLKPRDADGKLKNTHVPLIDTWRAMEQLVKDGLVESIGVSNFTIAMLEEILKNCEIPPAVNQIEIHPGLPQEELVAFCKKHNIVLTAYCPLARFSKSGPAVINHPSVLQVAEKYQKTPAQVLLNWGIARGYAVIPKSVTPSRIKENFVRFDMDAEDVELITEIGRKEKFRIW